jgi:hypothetical protein
MIGVTELQLNYSGGDRSLDPSNAIFTMAWSGLKSLECGGSVLLEFEYPTMDDFEHNGSIVAID